ncbi:hypothetical protein F4811DRAFT_565534 [Daldinia bambusicola]|nr:hypothetical protein F4811DRAFT_565534 [Daldinia bambusicola]
MTIMGKSAVTVLIIEGCIDAALRLHISTVKPLILYASAVALIFTGLYIPANRRDGILPFVWALLAASMHDISQLDWISGFAYQFGMLIIITFRCSPLIFHARKEPLRIEVEADGTLNCNLVTAYKIFNNPRMLPIRLEGSPRSRCMSNAVIVRFTQCRFLKVTVFVALNIGLNLAITPIFSTCKLDFSPARETILRRLISSTILDSVSQPEISHTLMSILFVAILRVNQPHEWPPLFGNPQEAYTLKRFWGRFWNRLVASAGVWARALVDQKALSWLPSAAKKVSIAFFIFTMSGIAYAIVGWRIGDCAPERDVLFFWYNFLAVCFEIIVSKYWPAEQTSYMLYRVGLQGRALYVIRRMNILMKTKPASSPAFKYGISFKHMVIHPK